MWSSNRKELVAVTASLAAFRRHLEDVRSTTILLKSDNSTVVADVNRASASATLTQPLRALLRRVESMGLRLQTIHIPGVTNTLADRLSRMGSVREYYLREEVFRGVTQAMGFEPELDIFAATPYLPSETAVEHPGDALRMPWNGKKLFLHPPPHLLTRTFAKAHRERAEAIAIVPSWTSQPWSPMLARETLREFDLGSFEECMVTTDRFRREGWKLPLGGVRAVLLGRKTTRESGSSEDF
jgi:hypothetical protein